MDQLTILVISQVDNAHVLIMFLVLNVMFVQLAGMVSQTVKVRQGKIVGEQFLLSVKYLQNASVTLMVLRVLVVQMMVEFVHAMLDTKELNVISVKQDGSWLMENVLVSFQHLYTYIYQ